MLTKVEIGIKGYLFYAVNFRFKTKRRELYEPRKRIFAAPPPPENTTPLFNRNWNKANRGFQLEPGFLGFGFMGFGLLSARSTALLFLSQRYSTFITSFSEAVEIYFFH